jgi:hypothetical protein
MLDTVTLLTRTANVYLSLGYTGRAEWILDKAMEYIGKETVEDDTRIRCLVACAHYFAVTGNEKRWQVHSLDEHVDSLFIILI